MTSNDNSIAQLRSHPILRIVWIAAVAYVYKSYNHIIRQLVVIVAWVATVVGIAAIVNLFYNYVLRPLVAIVAWVINKEKDDWNEEKSMNQLVASYREAVAYHQGMQAGTATATLCEKMDRTAAALAKHQQHAKSPHRN